MLKEAEEEVARKIKVQLLFKLVTHTLLYLTVKIQIVLQ